MKMFPYSDYNETNGNRNPIAELILNGHKKNGHQNPTNPKNAGRGIFTSKFFCEVSKTYRRRGI